MKFSYIFVIAFVAFVAFVTSILSFPDANGQTVQKVDGCNSNSNSSASPVKWIYSPDWGPDYGMSVTDVNITRSNCGIMVTGTIKNKYPDVTLLAVALKLQLLGKNSSETLATLKVDPQGILFPEQQIPSFVRVDPQGILKPNQTAHFVVKYDNPEIASNLDRIYAQFYSHECGVNTWNNMGCFGQRVNVTKVDPETQLPIK